MNNYIYNMPKDWYNFTTNNNSTFKDFNQTFLNEPNDLVSPKEGLERGNLFKNLYDPYLNYKYESLTPKNEQEEVLYNILKYKFALNDLALYLDVYPNNESYINLYTKYLTEEKRLCNDYEKKYGPLTLDSEYLKGTPWKWFKTNWPWEGTK